MWLGMLKHKKNFYVGLPKGYEMSHEIRNAERPRALPPSTIHYVEKHVSLLDILQFWKIFIVISLRHLACRLK